MALLLIIIAPNGHILANIAIVSQLSLAIDLSSKGLPGQLPLKFLKSEPGRLILSSARRSCSEMNSRGAELQHASFTILGTVFFNQQCPLGPCIPGLTHV